MALVAWNEGSLASCTIQSENPATATVDAAVTSVYATRNGGIVRFTGRFNYTPVGDGDPPVDVVLELGLPTVYRNGTSESFAGPALAAPSVLFRTTPIVVDSEMTDFAVTVSDDGLSLILEFTTDGTVEVTVDFQVTYPVSLL